jgi:putative transposase
MRGNLPDRKRLPHEVPSWVPDEAIYFVTVNTEPAGSNQLAHKDIATALWSSALFNADRGLWWPHLLVVMPDHLHGLISFSKETGIQKTITAWKHFTAHSADIRWQRDFFEHRLRNDESFDEKAHYIRMNPVRKGLCLSPDDWPYSWSLPRILGPQRSAGPTDRG